MFKIFLLIAVLIIWHSWKNRKLSLTAPIGDTNDLFLDALRQPHLLIAGATGSGKSVLENGLINTLLYRLPFDQPGGAQLILLDPKSNELHQYAKLPHTLCYAYRQSDMINALKHAERLMEMRLHKMQKTKCTSDNYIGSDVYVIIDEFADLMTTQAKTVTPIIQRLCQMGRASRIHVIICTQTPIAEVIPTKIKCNFDARFGLRTRSAQDSRNIIGKSGLEYFPKYGKGYYMVPEDPNEDTPPEGEVDIPYIRRHEIQRNIDWWMNQVRRSA